MNLPTRIAAHLTLVGCALVTAAVRPGHPSVAPVGAAHRPMTAVLLTKVQLTKVQLTTVQPDAGRAATATRRAHPRRQPHAVRPTVRRPQPVQPHRVRQAPAHAKHHRPASTADVTVAGPTSWSALNRAIARISTYRPGIARWAVSRRYGYWGTADWYHAVLYISPAVPSQYVYDVAVHEWSHELSVLDYDGDVSTATAAMSRYFGGRGLTGAERAADCMAVLQGATWTHYTRCTDMRWRDGAARLVRGEQL